LQHPLLEIQCKEGPEGQSQSLSGKHGWQKLLTPH
jgi:hypothetical protein